MTHICSLVVWARPEMEEAVKRAILAREGCEIHGAERGRIVVLIEHEKRRVMSEHIMSFNDIDGVISVSLVFEYSDTPPAAGEEAPVCETECADFTACEGGRP